MKMKSQILKALEENKSAFVSGDMLAAQLSVSRSAVWKTVKSLRADGYEIAAVTKKGYRLESSGDFLSDAEISAHLKTSNVFQVDVRKTVTSTNTVLRDMANKGAVEGYVIAAEEQTAGKGRMGRDFFSPVGHGAYFSLLLKPGSKASESTLITSAAAVATAKAIEEVTGVRVGIKWVNDLFIGGRKVCGILTEASFDMENGLVESAVLGIGINITRPDKGFPRALEGVATALSERSSGKDNERSRIIASTLDNFWEYYKNLSEREFLDEYRARSIIVGKDVYILSGDCQKKAKALSIDDDCGLEVRYENGETATLSSGEVSIREV